MNIQNLLNTISKQYQHILGDLLLGIYIHGSIAFGCFNWDTSDIDFIVVIDHPITQSMKLKLLETLTSLQKQAPPKGFEMSVVLKEYCTNFLYPTPYELHFSNACFEDYLKDPLSLCRDSFKIDYDLAAHFTIILHTGMTLYGQPISDTFGNIPKKYYLDSIYKDIQHANKEVIHQPVYVILNLCRVYAYQKEGLILSKEAGGKWGIHHLPVKYHNLIETMLNNYKRKTLFIEHSDLQIDFCNYMLNLIFPTPLSIS